MIPKELLTVKTNTMISQGAWWSLELSVRSHLLVVSFARSVPGTPGTEGAGPFDLTSVYGGDTVINTDLGGS